MKKYIPLLFPLIVLAVFAGAIIYLATRFSSIFETGTALWYSIFIGLLIFMISGLLVFNNTLKFAGSIVYRSAALTMGFMLYLLLSLLLVDLVNLLIPISKPWLRILPPALAGGILFIGLIKSFNTTVTNHQIKLTKYNQKLRIAHLSDIHIGHFRGKSFLQKLVNKVNKQNPDVVLITGDFFDGRINLKDEVLIPLTEMKAPIQI